MLRDELALVILPANVLDYGIGEREIELAVAEREVAAVGYNERPRARLLLDVAHCSSFGYRKDGSFDNALIPQGP